MGGGCTRRVDDVLENIVESTETIDLRSGEERKNRVEKGIGDFSELPPRVIIHEILPYCAYYIRKRWRPKTERNINNDCELFGYFSRDHFRNIWFVFSSLVVLDIQSSYILNTSRISSFQIIYYSRRKGFERKEEDLTAKFEGESTTVNSIVQLIHTSALPNSVDWESKFRSLERLSLDEPYNYFNTNHNPELIANPSSFLKSIFPVCDKLTSYELFHYGSVLRKEDFNYMMTHLKSSLKILQLVRIFNNQNKIIQIELPHLEKLKLLGCRNIEVLGGPKLRKLFFNNIGFKFVKKTFETSPNIRHLSMEFVNDLNDSDIGYWFSTYLSRLQNLKMLDLLNYCFEESFLAEDFVVFMNSYPNLEILFLQDCERVTSSMIRHLDYPRLKKLYLGRFLPAPNFADNFRWPIAQYLQHLSLAPILDDDLENEISFPVSEIFSANEFTSLEILNISIPFTIGEEPVLDVGDEEYLPIPNLKQIFLHGVPNTFSDKLFQNKNFCPNLELLDIENSNTLGKGWDESNFKNLESLEFVYLYRMEDTLFQEIKFPKLLKLRLNEVDNMTGFRWKKMPKLEFFSTYECLKFMKRKVVSLQVKGAEVYSDLWLLRGPLERKTEKDFELYQPRRGLIGISYSRRRGPF